MFGLFKKKKNEEELYLEDLERRRREAQAPDDTGFQMTVEDVFAISGRGTVVTGRISRGRISQGDRVLIRKRQGTVQEARIGGIEAFRRPLRTAEAGPKGRPAERVPFGEDAQRRGADARREAGGAERSL